MKLSDQEKTVAIIPARYNSQRYPGKPLAMLGAKTLINHCYDNLSYLENIWIATDDERIYTHATSFGAQVFMTPEACATGTDRIATLATEGLFDHFDIVLNVQGDEPFVERSVIESVIQALKMSPEIPVSTAITPLKEALQWEATSCVKCVRDLNGRALYFSRAMIPGNKKGGFSPQAYRHLGIYAYRPEFLKMWAELHPTPLSLHEDLEQLKILEHGYPIQTVVVESASIGIDTEEDLKLALGRLNGAHC